jgi:uDENN domain
VDYVAVVGAPEADIASACDSIETSLSTVGQSPAYRWRLERQQSRRSKRIASKSSSCDSRNMDVDNQSVSSLSSLEGVLETGNPTNDGPDGGNCSADRVLKEGLKVDSHTVLSRFPASDHCDNPFPTRLEWFTFPSGYKLRPFTESHGLPSTTAVKIHHRPPPSFTSFVLASKLGPVDLKLYGVALILHPTVRKNCTIPSYPDVSVDVSAPIAVVILSRYPVRCHSRLLRPPRFLALYRTLLLQFVREMQKILWHAYLSAHRHHSNGPFEMFSDLVRALVHEVPVPVPGSLSIKFSLKHESVTLSLPDAASFPKIAFPVSVVLKRFKVSVVGLFVCGLDWSLACWLLVQSA